MINEAYKAYAMGFVCFNDGTNQKTVEEAVAYALGFQDREKNHVFKTMAQLSEQVAKCCNKVTLTVPDNCVTKGMNVLVYRSSTAEEESSTFERVSLVGTPSVVEKLAKIIANHGELGL